MTQQEPQPQQTTEEYFAELDALEEAAGGAFAAPPDSPIAKEQEKALSKSQLKRLAALRKKDS